jgi:hypothetical protein
MPFLRAHVDPIPRHLDPTAVIGEDSVFTAYGLAANDLLRLKSYFREMNKYGLILVDRKDDAFRFLYFSEVVVIIYPGFRLAIEEIGLSFGADLRLEDISKMNDCEDMSKWITLSASERLGAENVARTINLKLRSSKVETLLGPSGMRVIDSLMWESSVFEPLHAITLLAKSEPLRIDIQSLQENLKGMGMDVRQMSGSTDRMLARRRKSRATLMDCAKMLFSSENYFEARAMEVSKALGIQVNELSGHFRGYLVRDDEYLKKLVEASHF